MRKLIPFVAGFMAVILVSCHKEEFIPLKTPGILSIDIGLVIRDHEVNKRLKAGEQPEDFRVIIYRADGTEVMMFATASVMPDSIELEPGNYFVVAHSDNDLPAAFDNPYYYGVSEVFSISSNLQQSVTVNCGLANTMVSVIYSDTLISSFVDYSTTVSSVLDMLVFTRDETRPGYFRTSPLEILVELSYLNTDGSLSIKTLSGSIAEPQAGRHYEIFVNTTIDQGRASFQILLDNTVIPVEVIEINDNNPIPPDNDIGYGDILLTEIMFDPSALSDTEGEWLEIYNHSGRTVNLRGLVLERDGTSRHTIADSIELLPGQYFVMARTATATDASNSYVYGSAISLPNTGAVLAIYNEDTGTGPGTMIFSVDYGGSSFPSTPGASISLNPDMLNASAAISGTSWCTSVSLFSTGDRGTPGMINDPCQ